jgi:glutathione S-transferase
MPRRVLFVSSLILSVVASAHPQEDPVLRARAQRASALGLADGDLPPVPRGIVEPPPLPPPEAHVKDSRKARRAKGRKGKSTTKKTRSTSAKAKHPVKGKGK